MALYQNYPYTDLQTTNLDYLLLQTKTNTESIQTTNNRVTANANAISANARAISTETAARDHGDRVASLLCIGANLTPEGVVDDDFDIEGIAQTNEAWAAWWDEQGDGVDPSLLSPTPEEARITAELMRLMLEEPHIEAESLEVISCPTTVMVGEDDCIDDYETLAIYQSIYGAKLVVVPFCGHVIPKYAPWDVSREL